MRSARLVGERVELRPVTAADADETFELIHGCEEVLRWLIWDGPATREELRAHYAKPFRRVESGTDGSDYQFAIRERASGKVIGSIGPRFQGHPDRGDIGYWSTPRVWGRGYMTEAVRLVTYMCFEVLAAAEMFGHVFVGNTGSRLVLERSAYRLEKLMPGAVMKAGEPRDEWLLSATPATWQADLPDWRPVEQVVELESGAHA